MFFFFFLCFVLTNMITSSKSQYMHVHTALSALVLLLADGLIFFFITQASLSELFSTVNEI